MTKLEIYEQLEEFESNDMILVNNEIILQNKDLNDDWFELSDYADDEEIEKEYNFVKVEHIDFKENFEVFSDDEGNIYETCYSRPTGCVARFSVDNIIDYFNGYTLTDIENSQYTSKDGIKYDLRDYINNYKYDIEYKNYNETYYLNMDDVKRILG